MKISPVTSPWQDQRGRFFEVPVRNHAGHCSEPGCSCNNTAIPRNAGYLYVTQKVVDFRKDCPTPADLLYKINSTQADLGCFEVFTPDHEAVYPRLFCIAAASRHRLDLDVAAQDAEKWWTTGNVPLRPTPRSVDR